MKKNPWPSELQLAPGDFSHHRLCLKWPFSWAGGFYSLRGVRQPSDTPCKWHRCPLPSSNSVPALVLEKLAIVDYVFYYEWLPWIESLAVGLVGTYCRQVQNRVNNYGGFKPSSQLSPLPGTSYLSFVSFCFCSCTSHTNSGEQPRIMLFAFSLEWLPDLSTSAELPPWRPGEPAAQGLLCSSVREPGTFMLAADRRLGPRRPELPQAPPLFQCCDPCRCWHALWPWAGRCAGNYQFQRLPHI